MGSGTSSGVGVAPAGNAGFVESSGKNGDPSEAQANCARLVELLEKEKAKGAEKVAQIKELLETERFLRVSLLQSKHEKGINSLTFPGDEIGSLIDTGKLAAEDVLVSRVGDQRREMERARTNFERHVNTEYLSLARHCKEQAETLSHAEGEASFFKSKYAGLQQDLERLKKDYAQLERTATIGSSRRRDLPTGSAKEGSGTEMSALLEEMDAMSEEVDRLQQENVTVMARARKSDEEVSLIRDDNSRLRVENSKLSQAAGALSRANTDLKRALSHEKTAYDSCQREVYELQNALTCSQQAANMQASILVTLKAQLDIFRSCACISGAEACHSKTHALTLLRHTRTLAGQLRQAEHDVLDKRSELAGVRAANARLEKSKADTAGAGQEGVNDELLAAVTCTVCDINYKNRMLNKCSHMFCNECIQENLRTRNRKCPECGTPFGAADVRTIYLMDL